MRLQVSHLYDVMTTTYGGPVAFFDMLNQCRAAGNLDRVALG